MKKILTGRIVLSAVLALVCADAFAKKSDYEGGTVSGGGSISGTVSYNGPAKDVDIDLTKEKNPEFCTTHPDAKDGHRIAHKIVANGGKLQGTVVFIKDIDSGKEWVQSTDFIFEKCDIEPKITVIRKSTKEEKKSNEGNVTVTNQDTDILHNPHGYSVAGANRKTLFNKPLPSKGSIAQVAKNLGRLKEKKDDHFFLQCDQHNFMEADARIVWNPYWAVTGADGSFKLTDVPPGDYEVIAWHPYAGEVSQKVSVKGGADAAANFEIKAK